MIHRPIDQVVEEFLVARAPTAVPSELQDAIVEQARRTSQRGHLVVLRGGARDVRGIVLVAAALTLGLLGAASLSGNQVPEPTPSAVAVAPISPLASPTPVDGATPPLPKIDPARPFIEGHTATDPSFEYRIPDDLAVQIDPRMVQFYVEPQTLGGAGGDHGLIVAIVDDAVVHPCPIVDGGPSRREIRSDAAGFLADLEEVAGVSMSTPVDVTIDGQPALQVDVDPTSECRTDVHIASGIDPGVWLDRPSRLIAFQAGGHDLAIVVWANDEDTLAIWLAVAQRVVDSIRFDG